MNPADLGGRSPGGQGCGVKPGVTSLVERRQSNGLLPCSLGNLVHGGEFLEKL